MKKITYILAMCFTVLLINPHLSFSEGKNDAADYLVEVAIRDYQKGDLKQAAHEFSKALILQPGHPVAMKYLNKMGFEKGFYPKEDQAETQQAHLKSFEQKSTQLEKDKSLLEAKFEQLSREHAQLQELYMAKDLEIELIEGRMAQRGDVTEEQRQKQLAQIQQIEDFYSQRYKELKYVNKELQARPEQIVKEVPNEEYMSFLKNAYDYENKMAELSDKNHRLQARMSAQRSHEDNVFGLIEEYVYIRRNEINRLGDELIYKEMELAKSQHTLLDKLDELIDIYKHKDESLGKIDQRNQLIEEKNRDIQQMIEALAQTRSQMDGLKSKIDVLESENSRLLDRIDEGAVR